MKRGTSAERDQLSSAVELLTSDEQDRVIQELHDTMAAQNRTIRLAFGVIFCFVAAIYCFCLLAFLHEPWSLVHQQRFEFTVAPSLLMSYYAISCAVFVVAALVCQRGRKMMHVLVSWSAILASVACLIGWALAFYANGVSNVLLYWLPLAPVGGIVVAYYVDGDISSLAADMVALESKKYNLKDV